MDTRIKRIRDHYELCDQSCDYSLKLKEQEGHTIACRSCKTPGCCRQEVRIYHDEITSLVEAVRQQPTLVQKAVDWSRAYLLLPWEEMMTPITVYNRKMWCPFLEDGRCQIYAHRPIVCRTLWVFAPDESVCNNDTDETVLTLDTWEGLHRPVAEWSDEQVWPMVLSIAALCTEDQVLGDDLINVITQLRKLWTRQDRRNI